MTQPLALVLYERLLPGSQLVNRLQDLNYRVRAVMDTATLLAAAQQEKPMLILADLLSTTDVAGALQQLKQNPETQHIPIIAFAPDNAPELQQAARDAGIALIVSEAAIISHLPQFLEEALRVE